ncbi:protein Mis18-beta [Bufo gargarizans]|uniref:protein Mis18-beta n=1 Tax=Bufo gargarizans TaxID=30331 RepID=UPI001CF186C0|nr:protein Mis18-beta [Bufo gargarizans]
MAGSSSLLFPDIRSVFMCKVCNTILTEGRKVCDSSEVLDLIAFLSVTKQVQKVVPIRYDVSPSLEGCVYIYLKCGVCTAKVGVLLICAVAEVAHLRNLYCLFKKSILCYSMKTKKLLEGSRFYFNAGNCVRHLEELEKTTFDTFRCIQQFADTVQLHIPLPLAEAELKKTKAVK